MPIPLEKKQKSHGYDILLQKSCCANWVSEYLELILGPVKAESIQDCAGQNVSALIVGFNSGARKCAHSVRPVDLCVAN